MWVNMLKKVTLHDLVWGQRLDLIMVPGTLRPLGIDYRSRGVARFLITGCLTSQERRLLSGRLAKIGITKASSAKIQ